MASQAGLQVIEVPRQHTLDEFRGERLLPDLMPFLQGPGEVVLDLERGRQAVGEERERGVRQNVLPGLCRGALFEEPGDIGALLPSDAVQQEDRGPRTDLLHDWAAQVIRELGMSGEDDRERL